MQYRYVVLNVIDPNGKKKKWIKTGLDVKGNRRKAEQVLRETIRDYESRENCITNDILFSDYIKLWLEKKKNKIDIITYQGYLVVAERMIIPYFA